MPPDYGTADGQHWGNPIYNWPRMEATGYAWWWRGVKRQMQQVDLLRLDHFRGFCQAWHIPASEKTARNGQWVDGPGIKLFEKLRSTAARRACRSSRKTSASLHQTFTNYATRSTCRECE